MVEEQTSDHGAIDIPEGLTKEWVLKKSEHLNKEFATWAETWMPSIDDNYRLFEGKPIGGMRPGATLLPLANSIIDTNMARCVSALVGRDKLVDAVQKTVSIEPQVPQIPGMPPAPQGETPEARVLKVEDLINESLTGTPYFLDKCDEMFKLLFLETICVAEVYWDTETSLDRILQRQNDPLTGNPLPVQESYQENVRSFPNFNPISIRSLAWSPREQWRISDSPWIRKRTMVSMDDLMKLEADGVIEDVETVVKEAPKSDGKDTKKDPDAQRAKAVEDMNLPALDYSDALYQLDEWWATITWKNNGELQTNEFRYWVVGEKVLVKFSASKLKPARKPFVSAKLNRKPGMLLAQGPMDIVKGLLVNIANTMLSKDKLIRSAATTPTYVEPSSGLDTRKQILEEGVFVPVLNAKGVLPGNPPVAAIGLINEHLNWQIGQAREATSANDMAQGIGSKSADTATEAKILEAGSSTRFQYNFEMVMNNIFSPMAKEYFLHYKQLGEDGKMVVREAGVDGKAIPVTIDDLKGDYEFRAVATQALQNRMGRFKLLEEVLTKLMTASSQDPSILTAKDGTQLKLTPFEFLTEQMLPMVDIKGVGTLFRTMNPQELMQAQMQKQMQMQAMAMGGPPKPNSGAAGTQSSQGGPAVLPGVE